MTPPPRLIATTLIGNVIDLTATFKDANGAAISPGIVTFAAKPPAGDVVTLPGTLTGGVWTAELDPDEAGTWIIRVTAAAPHQSAVEGLVRVHSTGLTDG